MKTSVRYCLPLAALWATTAIAARLPSRSIAPATQSDFRSAKSNGLFGVELDLLVQRGEDPKFRAAPLGEPLCPGDIVAFRVTPSASGYGTLLHESRTGETRTYTLLHPPACEDTPLPCSSTQKMAPAEPLRFPTDPGSGFIVSAPSGVERVLVMLSPTAFSRQAMELTAAMLHTDAPEAPPLENIGQPVRAIDTELQLRTLRPAEPAYVVIDGEELVSFSLNYSSAAVCPDLSESSQ